MIVCFQSWTMKMIKDNPCKEKMKKWNFNTFGQIIIGIQNLITNIKAVYAMEKACLIINHRKISVFGLIRVHLMN